MHDVRWHPNAEGVQVHIANDAPATTWDAHSDVQLHIGYSLPSGRGGASSLINRSRERGDQLTLNQRVAGSSPATPTNKFKNLGLFPLVNM